MSELTREELVFVALLGAQEFGLDPALVCALCEVESSWNPWAVRHEGGYKWVWGFKNQDVFYRNGELIESSILDADGEYWLLSEPFIRWPSIETMQTELLAQQTSWGLLGIRGADARKLRFTGWLTELCDPATNLEWGCRHLRWMLDHANDYGIEMIGSSPGAFGQHTPPAHTAYQSFDPNLVDLAAAWNGGKARIERCPICGGCGQSQKPHRHTISSEFPVIKDTQRICEYCHGTGKAYANEDYVKRVVRAMERYQ